MKHEIIKITANGVNCYLVKVEDGFILIDTLGHTVLDKEFTNRRDTLEKELQNAGCTKENLKLVVLTHGDNDHVANADYIRKNYNTNIALHKDDVKLVKNPDIETLMKSFNYKSLINRIIFKLMQGLIKKVTLKALNDFETFTPDIFIDDGFSLLTYGLDARIVHTPGHTKGSICILTSEGDLIAGDTFVNLKKPDTASNAIDFNELKKSIEKLKDMNIKTIYPGHGGIFKANKLKW